MISSKSDITESKRDKRWKWSLTVSTGHFLSDYYANILIGIIPLIAIAWQLSNVQIAVIVTFQAVACNFLQPVFGMAMDKDPRKWPMGISILITAIPMCLLYYANNYDLFLVLVVVGGIGCAMYHPLGAIRNTEGLKKNMPLKMSIFSGFGNFGFSISPAVTGYIIYHFGAEKLIFCLIPVFIWLGMLFIFKPHDEKKISQDKASTGNTEEKNSNGDKPDFSFLKNKPFLLFNFSVFLRTWLIVSVQVFIAVYIVSQGRGEDEAGFNVTCFLLAGTAGGFFFCWLYKYVPWKSILYGTYILSNIFLVTYFLVPESLRLINICLLGFVLFGTIPFTIIISQKMLPGRTALASGIVIGLTSGLAGIGNLLTGIIVDHFDVATGLTISSFIMIPAVVSVLLIKGNDVLD